MKSSICSAPSTVQQKKQSIQKHSAEELANLCSRGKSSNPQEMSSARLLVSSAAAARRLGKGSF
jgi:hypothetical protein